MDYGSVAFQNSQVSRVFHKKFSGFLLRIFFRKSFVLSRCFMGGGKGREGGTLHSRPHSPALRGKRLGGVGWVEG
jgi:hypothetical protein